MRPALVFCYYTYDSDGRPLHAAQAATLDAIERAKGVPLRETGMEVDAAELDPTGFLNRPPHCSEAQYTSRW